MLNPKSQFGPAGGRSVLGRMRLNSISIQSTCQLNKEPVHFKVYIPSEATPLEKNIHSFLSSQGVYPIDLKETLSQSVYSKSLSGCSVLGGGSSFLKARKGTMALTAGETDSKGSTPPKMSLFQHRSRLQSICFGNTDGRLANGLSSFNRMP